MKWNLLFIFVLALIAIYIVVPIDKPGFLESKKIRLGLDLSGGCKMIIKVDKEGKLRGRELENAVDTALEVFRRRLSGSGLKEPKISKLGDERILVLMPGTDETQVKWLMGVLTTVGKLELKEEAEARVKEKFPPDKIEKVPAGYQLYEYIHKKDNQEVKEKILVKDTPIITGEDIKSAGRRFGIDGWEVTLSLYDRGKRAFAEATGRLEGSKRRIAIIVDNVCISAPEVREKITYGEARITGNFDEPEARRLEVALKSGSLKSEIAIEQSSFVGPSLGQDSINKGMFASQVALAAICFFIILYYRFAGFIACISLALNLVLLLFIMSIFEATLTMPGIAGIVLTMGMAVDANIIIYERIREEVMKGKSAKLAFEAGYERAYITIFDANITTLIAGLILYYFGTDVIQGFAITLSIGILTTLFTGLFCTKNFIRAFINAGLIKNFNFTKFLTKPNLKYMESAPVFLTISLILIGSGVVLAFSAGERLFGIDFKGGNVVDVTLNKQLDISEVRKKFESLKDESGNPKYGDAEIQSIYTQQADTSKASQEFEIRTTKGNPKNILEMGEEEVVSEGVSKTYKKFLFYPQFDKLAKEELEETISAELKNKNLDFECVVRREQNSGFVLLIPTKNEDGESISDKQINDLLDGLKGSVSLMNEIERDIQGLFKDYLDPYPLIQIGCRKIGAGTSPYDYGNRIIVNLKEEKTLKEIDEKVRKIFQENGLEEPLIREFYEYGRERPDEEDENKLVKQFELVVKPIDNNKFLAIASALKKSDLKLTEEPFPLVSNISSSVAADLRKSGTISVILSWIAIIIYLAVRFSFKYGVSAVIALIHDVLISLGAIAAFILFVPPGAGVNVEIGLVSISAFLTIAGYSVNDSIVTFDRIRENLKEMRRESAKDIINASINQVLSRSLLTSFTTFIAVGVLFFITARSSSGISAFTFPFLIGVVVGTYSSIFVASPLLLILPKIFKSGERKQPVAASR